MAKKNTVSIETQDLSITAGKDDKFGRVITTQSLNEEDIIEIAVQRNKDISPFTYRLAMDLLNEIVMESIANGSSVSLGLVHFNLGVQGVFVGDNPKWDPKKHKLCVNVRPSKDLRKLVDKIAVNVSGKAQIGGVIDRIFDVASGEVNSKLTPGGGVTIIGSKIKIAGDSPENGIYLINQETGDEVKIPMSFIAVNDPGKLIVVLPVDLAVGAYNLRITTQFSSSKVCIKEARTCFYNDVLEVG